MILAPIVLFVYKRPRQTLEILEALSENFLADESTLYIFADGPKTSQDDDKIKIKEVHEIVRSKKWCKEVKIIERQKNIGLAENILSGVNEAIEKHGKVIVLEDDILTTKYFLQYMNDALEVYQRESKVLSIGACNFFAYDDKLPETFFINIPDCWGWATWRDRWNLFEQDGMVLLKLLKKKGLLERFNLYGKYNFEQMLLDQIEGRNNSWAIRWQAVAYINNMLTLYPKYSVVKNIGNGSEATHGGGNDFGYNFGKIAERSIGVQKNVIEVDPFVNKLMLNTYDRMRYPKKVSWMKSLKLKLRF